MWTDSNAINFTSNSSSWLNTEGTINDGNATDAFANFAVGDGCATQGTSMYMRGQGPGTSVASTGKNWTAYRSYSECLADASSRFNGIENPYAYRPLGFRSISFNNINAPGSICCRNVHDHFNCNTWNMNQSECTIHADACSWNSGNSTCIPN